MCPIQDERLRRLERPATWPPKRLALQLPATTTLMPVRRHAAAVSCPKAAKTLSSPFTTFITDSYAPRAVIAGMNECLKLGGARCCPVLIYVPRLRLVSLATTISPSYQIFCASFVQFRPPDLAA